MSQKFLNPVEVDGQVSAEYLDLSTSTSHSVNAGELAWNSIDGTFDIGLLNGVTLQVGQEMHFYGKATEAISNGNAVMFAGVQGDHILIAKATPAAINANPEYFMGVATQNFTTNQFGYVTAFGNVRGLNTTGYTLGTVLYFDSNPLSSPGLITEVKPTAPNAKVEVAAVVRVHATQGILMVRPHTMPKLSDVQDVKITGISANNILYWTTSNRWENGSVSTVLGYTPANSSHTHTFDSLTSKTGGTGTYQTSGDFRAPRFYDSNDTGYYVDPNSTSNVSALNAVNTSVRRYYQTADGVPTSNLGSPSVTEMALFDNQFNNKTEFLDPAYLKFYTSTDGVSWTEYTGFSDVTKRDFVGGDNSSGVVIPNLTPYFAIEVSAVSYVYLNALYMYWSSNSHNTSVKVQKRRVDNATWYNHTTSETLVSAWPGHLYLPFSSIPFLPGPSTSTSHFDKVRFVFQPNWASGTYASSPINLYKFECWGGYPAGKRNIYATDSLQNVTFPASLRAKNFTDSENTAYYTDPSSTSNLNGLTVAGTITGNISGNAGTATTLQTARTINGTSFNGSANIETSYWGATRTITIGATGKTVNGSGNQSWSLAEIGAYAATNPNGYTSNTGTVTSVSGTGGYGGLTLSGTVVNSGSLTLGGTPSGTWPISITGNSTSVSGLTLTSSANGINPNNVTQNQLGYNTNVNLFGQTDGGLYSSAYSSVWIHQIYGDFRTGQIAIRGKNSGTWQAWRTVLDSSNFGSYAASTSHTHTFDSLTNKTLGTGTYQTSGDFRAPIFYDSNNTGYYLDPSSTSNLYNVTAKTFVKSGGTSSQFLMGDGTVSTNPGWLTSINSTMVTTALGYTPWHAGNDGSGSGLDADTVDGIDSSRIIYGDNSSGSSNISNATLDAALKSGFYTVGTGGIPNATAVNFVMHTAYYSPGNTAGFDLACNDSLSSSFYLRPATGGGKGAWQTIITSSNVSSYAASTSHTHTFDSLTNKTLGTGTYQTSGDFRAPIFYDSNNTSYYLDPSSGGTAANLAGKIEIQGGSNSNTAGLQITSNYGAPYIATYYGIMHTSNDLYIGPVASSGNNLYANNSYANIFYDKNSTSYYFDGSSTGDSIRVAGDIVAYYSDEKLKDKKGNIKNALEKVLSLNGFYYEPNNKAQELGYKKKLEVGVSAQEVEAILPEIIKDAPIGQGYKTLDYGKLTPLLIEAIKEQQEQIQEQQKQIDELKELVNKLITK